MSGKPSSHVKIRILPSLLASDFAHLAHDVERVERAGADMLHVDVMDGHFVPNITVGPFIVEAIRRCASIPLDVHLMIDQPDRYADAFIDAGADRLTFHIETGVDVPRLLAHLQSRNVSPGLCISPDTTVEAIKPYLTLLDRVLVMTVYPGFGGQKLIDRALEKARELRSMSSTMDIEVDGGINAETIARAASMGPNEFVAGTAIFGAPDAAAAIAALRQAAQQAFRW